MEAENHVVVGSDELGGIDDPALESGVDLARGQRDDGRAGPGDDLAAKARNAHLEPLVVGDGGDLLPEPPPHLRGALVAWTRNEIEGRVGLLPELESIA